MNSTLVRFKCISKKESINWNIVNPRNYAIELEVPYDQASIFWKMTGGTNLVLNTVNKDAADMFQIESSYDVVISPTDPETTV